MSFAQEMKDFYAGFKATSDVASDIRNAKAEKASIFDFGKSREEQPGIFGPGLTNKRGTKSNYAEPDGDVKKVIDENVPEGMREFAYKMAYHESRYDPSAVSPTGATGLFQFTKGTGAQYGLVGENGDMRADPALNAQAFVKLTEANRSGLAKALGREPSYGELALAHQQGLGGATYLLTGKGSPKVIASIKQNLAHNNIKSTGRDAAAQIASFYGFEIDGEGLPEGVTSSGNKYTQWTPDDYSSDVASTPTEPYTDAGSDFGDDEDDTQDGDILAGSRNAAIDVDYSIPGGAKLYAAGDLTQPPTMYSAEGGSVPWQSETSYLRKQNKVKGKYRPKQAIGELEDLPDVADGGKPPNKNPNNKNPNNKNPNNPNIKAINDAFVRSTGTPGTSNYVMRSPRVNTGTPGTSNFVQRQVLENTGTPGTSNYVQRQGASTGLNSSAISRTAARPAAIMGVNSSVAPKPAASKPAASKPAAPVAAAPVAAAPKPAAPKPKILAVPLNPTKNNFAVKSTGAIRAFAEGGLVDDTEEQEAIPVAAAAPALAAPRPAAAIPTQGVTSVGNPRGSGREDLAMEQRQAARSKQAGTSNAIDAGLKYLTKSLGLDRSNTAVGPDPQLTEGRRRLVNGAVGPNEGPPTQQEVEGMYQVVDPNNELGEGLKNVYAMKKGYEFYMQRGEPEKAAKFAAGVIQYSNLLSRRFGYEAVQAGQNGDQDSMVKYAIKAYDAIPDGLSVEAKRTEGGMQVTRTDEDGEVVDQHLLSPQQIFQMATGISQGSGYFEALMDVAGEGEKPLTALQKKRLAIEERSLKLREAELSAKEAGAGKPKVPTAAEQRIIDGNKAGVQFYTTLYPTIKDSLSPEQQEAWDKASAAGEPKLLKQMYDAIIADQDKATQKQQKIEEIGVLKGLLPDYEADLSPAQQSTLDKAFETGNVAAINRIFSAVDRDRANKASSDKSAGTKEDKAAQEAADLEIYSARYDDLAPNMSEGQKRAWKLAVEKKRPAALLGIINEVTRAYGVEPAEEGDPPPPTPTSAIDPGTSQSNAGKPMPPNVLASAKAAIAEGRSRAGVIAKLEKMGYSTEGL
jgi:hypothetical protein